jgi:pilus assembly protein TadC
MAYIFDVIAQKHVFLERDLALARIDQEPREYVKKTVKVALFLAFALTIMLTPFILLFQGELYWLAPFFGAVFILCYFVFIASPRQSYKKAEELIDQELISAIRFLILETKIEPSLYFALVNTSRNFPVVGIYLDEVLKKVELGMTLEQALFEEAETIPSENLRNIFWQMTNSIQSGANVTKSLNRQLEEIIEGQKIKINNYGKELSALTLFYMFISIIIPTVGFAIVLAVLSVAGILLELPQLLGLWMFITLVQYFFLQIVLRKRPSVEAH